MNEDFVYVKPMMNSRGARFCLQEDSLINLGEQGCKLKEIIREGPSTTRPPVLNAGWEPPIITVDDQSIPKSELDWTDAEEQFSVENSRALNAIFNSVDLNIAVGNIKFEALKMSEEETIVDYNEGVLEIANESFNFGEKIPESKIVLKVLRSLSENLIWR
ncbi:gag-pol polyprotein [Cucumis melo var. makuwa]|uniref:Gag-pol polyprotein n=1 Tax=Cucumis melo var. makuwa TaxID=1194695 RepID=A0A5A7T5R7_CUCMM|nr:gag-pol polyprotein [Cucumis melo var. makuwa]